MTNREKFEINKATYERLQLAIDKIEKDDVFGEDFKNGFRYAMIHVKARMESFEEIALMDERNWELGIKWESNKTHITSLNEVFKALGTDLSGDNLDADGELQKVKAGNTFTITCEELEEE